jgi:hypothetical protein
MSRTMKCIIRSVDDEIILQSAVQQVSDLYFVDVRELCNLECQPRARVMATRRRRPMSDALVREVVKLHERMHHAPSSTIAFAIRHRAWLGVDLLPEDIEYVFSKINCLPCWLAKMHRLPSPQSGLVSLLPAIGFLVSVDFVPVSPPSLAGHVGFFLFRERLVGYMVVILTKSKAVFLPAVLRVMAFYAQYGHTMRQLRVDAGTVERSNQRSQRNSNRILWRRR